jgi:hypothetical protein
MNRVCYQYTDKNGSLSFCLIPSVFVFILRIKSRLFYPEDLSDGRAEETDFWLHCLERDNPLYFINVFLSYNVELVVFQRGKNNVFMTNKSAREKYIRT